MNVTVDVDCIYEESIIANPLYKNRRVVNCIDKLLTHTENIFMRSLKEFNMHIISKHYRSFLRAHSLNPRKSTIKANEFYYISKDRIILNRMLYFNKRKNLK